MEKSQPILHDLKEDSLPAIKIAAVIGLVLVLGVVSGWGLNFLMGKSTSSGVISGSGGLASEKKTAVGTADEKSLRDTTEGTLVEGGINGEGTHKLIRPGGESQTVYLTSSMVDLAPFVNKKVKVWGETYAGKQAGWLMDIAKIETVE